MKVLSFLWSGQLRFLSNSMILSNKLTLTEPNEGVKSSGLSALLDTLETSDISKHNFLTFYCSNCGYSFPVYMRCGDRTCPDCRSRDYFRLLGSYRAFLASKSRLRLITLTMRGRLGFLPKNRVVRLRRAFKKLLKKSYYRSRLVGGLYSIEAKKKLNGWNIHMHILAEGSFIEQKKLSRDWLQITGDSFIVDIRDAYSGLGGLKYILKYLTKSPDTLGCNDEYNQAFKGARLVSGFGTWYKKILLLEKEAKICPVCGCQNWLSEYELFWLGIKAERSPPYKENPICEMSADINRTSQMAL